jgi:chromosome partitioning protein
MSKTATVLVFPNVKGGVTKTTTTLSVGIMLQLLGARVLVVDADPQGNTTDGLGYTPEMLEHTTYTLMTGKSTVDQTVKPTYFNRETGIFFDPTDEEELAELQIALAEKRAIRGPDLLPCNIDAAVADNELVGDPGWGFLLGKALEGVLSHYDFAVIDTNPGLGKLTVNGFLSSDYIVIPSIPERWPTSGIRLLCGAIANAYKINRKLRVAGILFTRVRYAEHKRHMELVHQTVLPEVNKTFPWMQLTCFETFINESANFSRTVSERSNIILALSGDAITVMYWGFLAELLKKIQNPYFDAALKMYKRQYALYQEDQAKQAEKKPPKRSEVLEERK